MSGGPYFTYSGTVDPFPNDWKEKGHFRPAYGGNVPQIPPNFQELSAKDKASIITHRSKYTKTLTSTFYQYLAREFLLGDTLHEGGLQMTRGHNGQEFLYLPDIIQSQGGRGKNKTGEIHFEVKACNTRNKILAPPAQTAKYAATLHDGEFEGMPVPNIQSVLFRYYPRQDGQVFKKSKSSTKTYRNPKLLPMSEFTGYQLTNYLAQHTTDCVIVPMNLYLLLSRTGYESLDSSDKAEFKEMGVPPYFVKDIRIRAAMHTGLAEANISLEDLISQDKKAFHSNAKRFGLSPRDSLIDLYLNRLRIRKFEVPATFAAVHGDSSYPVKPFKITEYYMDDADNNAWLKHLRANFADIMQQSGLEDYTLKADPTVTSGPSTSGSSGDDDDKPFG